MVSKNSSNFSDPVLRDFFITKSGLIFSVPDYFHPQEGIRSILRYVPDPAGDRVLRGTNVRYRKAGFEESFDIIKKQNPAWVKDVIVVPREEIEHVLKPNDVVCDILSGKIQNPAALEIIRRMENFVPVSAMGISGSVLAGLDNENSDIDFLVYGTEWEKARTALNQMKKSGFNSNDLAITELDDAMWQTVYEKRKSPLSFEEFFAHEIRKGNRGMIHMPDKNVYFDLLFARSPEQITVAPKRGIDTEKIEIEAVVTNADFAFDSPAIYEIDHPEILEIFSYTHTYAGQAHVGEKIRARGLVEVIGKKKRLVIGTKREIQDEWMVSLTLIEK
ncbi:hypothetical protein MsAg5_13700 [Methanosarcinaceae archaeon Ag5]|uniref:Polymerase nucleotidyl transferase domain-containing protein n=1 Tax=Methanolapillus africanus TaxID=3028297 RepID=A0AAE4MKD9_9EURY|nr:hypothetical protein [Methanosarcinaceae archaeon Ag5]